MKKFKRIDYLNAMLSANFITKENVSEEEKYNEDVYKVVVEGKTLSTTKYVKYTTPELSDEEIDRIIQLKQLSYLKSISAVLTFYFIVTILAVFILIISLFN